ncbi:aminotransferase class V-fold PLP-dependent enzyme [Kitasatospora sp. NPDC048239]|uniref:aminotransferase class V-fold PLP-dependent enzyme n=1 Tax=Kitasatospora sp. NPDC048239 TaxID=3364046 RepID=UPI00371FBC5A
MTEALRTVEPPAPLPDTDGLFTLDGETAHLNHGSFGAVPVPVQRVQERLRREMERDPDGFFADLPARVAAARVRLAAELGADPDRSVLVGNVTEGIAIVLDSVPLAAGDRILLTDHGYGAVELAVRRRAAEAGAEVHVVRLPLDAPDEDAVREAVLAGVDDRTVLAVLDQITSVGARRIAAPELLAALRGRGVTTVVDGAHAPGTFTDPIDEAADFWVGNLHKWAFAPRATGLLAVRPEWAGRVRPLAVSWEHAGGFPAAVEWRGTVDYTAWLAAPAGFEVLHGLGAERVRAHNDRLAEHGQRVLAERAGLRPLPGQAGVPMRALRLPPGRGEVDADARAVMAWLWERAAVRIAVRPWAGGGVLRVSAQLYNRPEEYERLAAALGEMLRG